MPEQNPKSIKQIIPPTKPHWVGNGFFVHGFFNDYENENSPFLLLDYAAKKSFEPANTQRGVGSHPHRGFETVTIALSGKVAHHDSAGNSGIIEQGDVQWMTAGSGILHQEYFEKNFNESGGDFQMVQLWINLPAKDKMTKPKYQAISHSKVPVVEINQNKIKIIAGKFEDISGIANTFSPVEMYIIDLVSDLKLNFPENYTTMILILDGEIQINGQIIQNNHLVTFEKIGQKIELKTNSKVNLSVISGEPLDEPIAHYGPFVMNTKQQLVEAIEDFNTGKFGQL